MECVVGHVMCEPARTDDLFTPKNVKDIIINFNTNLKLFLRLSNCASIGGNL
jgi:hypothetical protein